jgi:TonB-linked SusC/RagA family outer membrane protein
MMKMEKLILMLLCIAGLTAKFSAQNQPVSWTVTGIVTDATTADPLIGVTVMELGTSNGTVTDFEGRYQIVVAGPEVRLVFRYTGYAPQEVVVNSRNVINVMLGESPEILEELVVVGYGVQKKSDLTGAVSSVKGEDIARVATGTVEQALQGKVSGVYVTPSSGAPGAGAVIRIRGTGTLNNSNPLYVIDGMITYDASHISPNDVQSIEVLKDASAAAIYGSRGANGVIIITTRRGAERENALITASAYYGIQQVTRKIELLNAAEFAAAYNDLSKQNYYPNPEALGAGTDWQDQIFHKAPIANYTVSAGGGTAKARYNISANYFNQDGILKYTHFDRLALRANADYSLNKAISIGHNVAYMSARIDNAPNVIASAYRMPPVFAERDSTGKFSDPTYFGLPIANPAADLFYKNNNHSTGSRLFGNVYGEVKFAKHFTFRSNLGIDKITFRSKYFEPRFEVSASQRNLNDRLSAGVSFNSDWIWEQTLTFDQTIRDDHHITFLVGYTAEERKYENLGGSRENFPGTVNDLLYLSAGNDTTQMNYNGAGDEALTSNLFRLNYTFRNKYLLTVSWRTDRSSRFTKANRTGHFPSASVGWNMSEEPFIANLGLFDRLKFRASYGILGNQASASQYPATGAVTGGLYGVFGTDESLQYGATLTSLANANLQWETSRQADIGVEVGLLDGRLTIEADWYDRETYDIIAAVPIPDYVGSQADPVVNTARVKNHGFDISAQFRQVGQVDFNFGVILSPVTNRVVKLAEGRNQIFAAFLEGEPATHTIVGLPIGAFYGYKTAGIFQSEEEIAASPTFGNEEPGDIRFADTNGDGVLNGDDRVYLGSPIPTLTYTATAGFGWKGFDLNADIIGASGHKVYNAKETFRTSVYNWEKHVADRWTPDNPSNTEPRIHNSAHNYRVSDRFLADASYVRLRSVALGYTLPEQITRKAKLERMRIYVSGLNIWTKQKYKGYSPEFPNGSNAYEVGFDFGAYPIAKSWQGGIEIQF